MTRYEDLIERAEDCHYRALATNNVCLKKFYLNAEQGYREKAVKLTISQACEIVK